MPHSHRNDDREATRSTNRSFVHADRINESRGGIAARWQYLGFLPQTAKNMDVRPGVLIDDAPFGDAIVSFMPTEILIYRGI
jgi:hypothetical protein